MTLIEHQPHEEPGDPEPICHTVEAMTGFLPNSMLTNDSVAAILEVTPRAFAGNTLAVKGWEVSKHGGVQNG